MFATATQGSGNDIQCQLLAQRDSDKALNHILEDSIMILNVTGANVHENRQVIIEPQDVKVDLQSNVQTVSSEISSVLFPFKDFMLHYLPVAHYESPTRDAVDKLRVVYDELFLSLSDMFTGKVTHSLLAPRDPGEVQGLLPAGFLLPFDLRDGIYKYYEYLYCSCVVIVLLDCSWNRVVLSPGLSTL